MLAVPKEAFEIGILNKDYHARLLADVDHIAATAGIPAHFVWSKLSEHCQPKDLAWVRKIKQGKGGGACYVGTFKNIEARFMAIAGACLRNYIDARVMPVHEVIARIKAEDMPEPTVLLIPNFFIEKAEGGQIAQWQISGLLGLLYSRLARGHKTVIYVSNLSLLKEEYGVPFAQHIEAHYTLF